jgi:type II secretory pathway component GspD/PulD (secretin)
LALETRQEKLGMARIVGNRIERLRATATTLRGAPPRLATVPRSAAACAIALLLLAVAPAGAQTPPGRTPPSPAEPIEDVLASFAEYSGKSIVIGPEVTGFVTAYISDRPWDVALRAILSAHGWVADEDGHGIVRVTAVGSIDADEEVEPLITRMYRLSFAKASELAATLAPHLSNRGTISVAESTNALVISDVARVHRTIGGLLR